MEQFAAWGPAQAVRSFWNSLNSTQKTVSVVFLAVSVGLLLVVSVVATKPRMGVLFSGLESQDAGSIVAKLQERKVAYEIAGDGSVIKVPTKEVHQLRLEMATAGLPHGGSVGFEIFDKTSLGMTEFAQRLNYQRALQGELCRTIAQLDNVEQARVHVAIPEKSVFKSEEKHPAASVVVKLRPGRDLNPDQVAGIVHLVASAIEGMKPNHVALVDTHGNVLSEAGDDVTGLDPRLSASQLQLKQTHERQVQKEIQSMLERVLGSGKAVVRVNARMNFDRRETNSELYNPLGENGNTGVLSNERRFEETYGRESGTAGGVVGVPANSRPTQMGSSSNERGYHRTETTNQYQVSKTTEHVISAPGTVEQLSLAVMLDGKIDSSRIPAIQSAVEAAAGIDIERGDKVIVERVPFDDSAVKEQANEMKALAARETYMSAGKTAAGVLLLIGFLFFLRNMFRQIKVSAPEPRMSPVMQTGRGAAVMSDEDYGQSAAVGAGASSKTPQADPEDVARVVRQWIARQ